MFTEQVIYPYILIMKYDVGKIILLVFFLLGLIIRP